jgi:hypothetical protein
MRDFAGSAAGGADSAVSAAPGVVAGGADSAVSAAPGDDGGDGEDGGDDDDGVATGGGPPEHAAPAARTTARRISITVTNSDASRCCDACDSDSCDDIVAACCTSR